VDGDGRSELAVIQGGGVRLWRLTAAREWQPMPVRGLPAAGTFQAVQLADMDGDGRTDAVAFGRGLCLVLLGDGTGGFREAAAFRTPLPGNATVLRAGRDVDHNGKGDIVLMAEEGGSGRNTLRCYVAATARPPVPRVRITAPGAGRVLRGGAVRSIDWCSAVPSGVAASVAIELSTAGLSGPWQPVAAGVADSGRYQWRVPPVASVQCRLRVTITAGGSTAQAIGEAFTIQ
jgi:hypothetical protein